MSGRAMELLEHESGTSLGSRGALSVLDASHTLSRASCVSASVSLNLLRSDRKPFAGRLPLSPREENLSCAVMLQKPDLGSRSCRVISDRWQAVGRAFWERTRFRSTDGALRARDSALFSLDVLDEECGDEDVPRSEESWTFTGSQGGS